MCVYICTYVLYVCTWTCAHVRIYVCTCMYAHVCMHMYVCTCTCAHVRIYVCTCMCAQVRMYVFTCTYVCVSMCACKEVGGLLRWLLPQVSLEGVWRERQQLYRFAKPHQLAIDGTMPANIKKFLGGDLFGAGWGIPGLPLMNSFMKPLQLPILYRICASREKH